MGIDCGFDIFPRLDGGSVVAYHEFVEEVLAMYGDEHSSASFHKNGKIISTPTDTDHRHPPGKICFCLGEAPAFPSEAKHCNYFLRFSSKITKCSVVEHYIREVCQIAKKHFGAWRVHFWHEFADYPNYQYAWSDINEADRLFHEQLQQEK
jgi:hypothetical protein